MCLIGIGFTINLSLGTIFSLNCGAKMGEAGPEISSTGVTGPALLFAALLLVEVIAN